MKKNLLTILIIMTSCVNHLQVATLHYDNGQVQSTGKLFSDSNGPIIRTGVWQEFYPNGQLKSKGEYAKDYRFYNCPQNFRFHYNYKIGPWVYYHQNGKIWAKGTYRVIKVPGELREHKFGILDSSWIFFDTSGTKTMLRNDELLQFRLVTHDEEIENPEIFLIYDKSEEEIEIRWIENKTAHNNK